MYDVIVVGARCAGSPVAMLLAQRGYRVVLVDRATFPSDQPLSTHIITPPGVARLATWGVLDAVRATGCPPIREFAVDVGPFTLTGCFPPVHDVSDALCPRRIALDAVLVDAAVAAGAELRQGFTVTDLMVEAGRVVGIRGRDGQREVTERARLVVGADGLHSVVARSVDPPRYSEHPPLTCTYFAYWSGVGIDRVELCPRERRLAVTFPTSNGLNVVAIQWPAGETGAFRQDVEANFLETLDIVPELRERVASGTRESRFVGTSDLPFFFRKPYGDGWALVGDAGYHTDPNIGPGISNAFRDAAVLAEEIDAGLSGRGPLDDALKSYEHRQNEAAMPHYQLGIELARLEAPGPEMRQLWEALRHNQRETDRWVGTIVGTVPIPEFYAPENLARIIRRGSVAQTF